MISVLEFAAYKCGSRLRQHFRMAHTIVEKKDVLGAHFYTDADSGPRRSA